MAIREFSGDVYFLGDENYRAHRYQYAYSSHKGDGSMRPSAILYAKSVQDIKAALSYAHEANVAMSVRTGGHQYSGASSTAAPNIQLDLSNFSPDDFEISNYDPIVSQRLGTPTPTVRVSVCFKLRDLNERLGTYVIDPHHPDDHLFIPHGQCSNVHVGGHLHTGGYGQLGRSFGLFGDHVEVLEVVLPDGSERTLRRGQEEDKELMFSILGGSPGNFCVVHHVTLRLHRDSDHPKSCGLRVIFPYSKSNTKKLLDIVADIANDPAYPGDFDYCVTVISSSLSGAKGGIDERMQIKHPEEYGPNDQGIFPAGILVYAQWANLQGEQQPMDDRLFRAIRNVSIIRVASVTEDQHTPMSKLTRDWVYMNIREFELPYEKRTYFNAPRLAGSPAVDPAWSQRTANRIHIIQGGRNDCKLSIQIQPFGGLHSSYANHVQDGYSSYSWRDSTVCSVMDCFYSSPAGRDLTMKWQAGNDKQIRDKTFGVDRRVLWGSYGTEPLYDVGIWPKYYTDETYRQHCKLKQRLDPTGVLTPNTFCVLPRPGPLPAAPLPPPPPPPPAPTAGRAGKRVLRAGADTTTAAYDSDDGVNEDDLYMPTTAAINPEPAKTKKSKTKKAPPTGAPKTRKTRVSETKKSKTRKAPVSSPNDARKTKRARV